MNNSKLKKITTAGALMLSVSVFSLPAVSQQGHSPCSAGGGISSMGMGQKPMMGGMTGGGHMGMMGGGQMGMMGGMMGGGHMGMMKKYKKLGLSDEQEQQISEIQHKLHKQHWAIMGPMIDVKAELRKAHAGDRPDPKAIGAVYGKMFDLKRQMIEATLEAKNSAKDVLTEEQIAQMKQMKHKRQKMMQGQGGMMQGQGGQTN